ncbi:hypothetical protein Esti_003925 [Eimeria stiedai]
MQGAAFPSDEVKLGVYLVSVPRSLPFSPLLLFSGKHPKEETTHGAGKEFKAEHHKRSKKLQDADGIANRENGEQAKEAVGNIEEKIFSKKEIHEMIASQQRLREELEQVLSKQLETSALRKLVDALVEGAVPLAVPVEVFYKIGQQYLEKNAHAFSLQFPPLEELLSKADNVGDSSDTEALDFRGGEGEAGGEANGEGADNEGSLEGFEVFDELEEAAEPAEDSRGQKAKLLEEKRKEEMFTKSIAERKAKSLLALEAWQREEGLAATFSGLLEELKLKSEMSETLLQQNEIMRKQNQILTQQVSRWEKEFHVVDEKYQELQDKVNCITKQAEAILRNNKEIPPTETISIMPELKGEALDMQWRGRPTPSKTPGAPTASGTLAVNNKVIPVIVAPPVCHKFQSTMQQKRGDFLPSAEPDKPSIALPFISDLSGSEPLAVCCVGKKECCERQKSWE